MELIKYRKTLDVHKNGVQFMLQGFQTADNLSRVIEISLMASGDAIDFPLERIVAMMYVTTPGAEEPSINSCTIKDNKVVYDVLPIVEEGITKMQLKLIETSPEGAKRVLCTPEFAVEVSESGANDDGEELKTTFTAIETFIAKADAAYGSRLERIELTSDCMFKAYYADGTTYETDILQKLFLNGNVELSKSYAMGGTGVRAGEDTDNSKYYSNVSRSEALNAKDIMENSEDILEEVRLHGVYTAFKVDFETGDVEYVSPSFKFKVNMETGELETEGQSYTFNEEIGRVVVEWLESKNVIFSDIQDTSKAIKEVREYSEEAFDTLNANKMEKDNLYSFGEVYHSHYGILEGHIAISTNRKYMAHTSQGILTVYRTKDMSVVGSIEHGYFGQARIEMDDSHIVICNGVASGTQNDVIPSLEIEYATSTTKYHYMFFKFSDESLKQITASGDYGTRLRFYNYFPCTPGTSSDKYFYFLTEVAQSDQYSGTSVKLHRLDKSNDSIVTVKTMNSIGGRLYRVGDDVIVAWDSQVVKYTSDGQEHLLANFSGLVDLESDRIVVLVNNNYPIYVQVKNYDGTISHEGNINTTDFGNEIIDGKITSGIDIDTLENNGYITISLGKTFLGISEGNNTLDNGYSPKFRTCIIKGTVLPVEDYNVAVSYALGQGYYTVIGGVKKVAIGGWIDE